jgi:hypothetical protein
MRLCGNDNSMVPINGLVNDTQLSMCIAEQSFYRQFFLTLELKTSNVTFTQCENIIM